MNRVAASAWISLVTWLLGVASVFALTGVKVRDILQSMADFFGIEGVELKSKFFSLTFFDMIDYLTANIMLPIGGLLIAIFAGWMMTEKSSMDEFAIKFSVLYKIWRILVRYITPLAVIIVFLNVIGVIEWLSKLA